MDPDTGGYGFVPTDACGPSASATTRHYVTKYSESYSNYSPHAVDRYTLRKSLAAALDSYTRQNAH